MPAAWWFQEWGVLTLKSITNRSSHTSLPSISSGKYPFWLNQPLLWTQLRKRGGGGLLLPTSHTSYTGTNRRNASDAQTWCLTLWTHYIIASIREGKKLKVTEIKPSAKSYRRVRIWTDLPVSKADASFFTSEWEHTCICTHTPFRNNHFIYSVFESHHFLNPENIRTRRQLRHHVTP